MVPLRGGTDGKDTDTVAPTGCSSARRFAQTLQGASQGQNSNRMASALQTAALRDYRSRRPRRDLEAEMARHTGLRAAEACLTTFAWYRERRGEQEPAKTRPQTKAQKLRAGIISGRLVVPNAAALLGDLDSAFKGDMGARRRVLRYLEQPGVLEALDHAS